MPPFDHFGSEGSLYATRGLKSPGRSVLAGDRVPPVLVVGAADHDVWSAHWNSIRHRNRWPALPGFLPSTNVGACLLSGYESKSAAD